MKAIARQAWLWAALGTTVVIVVFWIFYKPTFSSTVTNGSVTITKYNGGGRDVTIPGTINNLPVTTIGEGAFWGCTNLTSVTIPNSVTNIGRGAFEKCTSLTNVTIPSSVASIGYDAFLYCTCLTGIGVNASNPAYGSVDGVLFDKSQTTLIRYPIGKPGSSYAIPSSVTSIGDGAFKGCTSLTNVTIGTNITSIGRCAFSGCTSLTSVTISSNVTNIGFYAFGGCTSLANILIDTNIISIGNSAFAHCTILTNVTIPDGVTSIGRCAFSVCTSLTSVTIPSSVTNIGQYAFIRCTSLTGVYFKGDAPHLEYEVCAGADKVTIYYQPGTTGWTNTFGGRPTAIWKPETNVPSAGVLQ